MHPLAGHVAVDQRLRQPLGDVAGPLQAAQPQRQGQADRAGSRSRPPRSPAGRARRRCRRRAGRPGASRAGRRPTPSATSASSYCRSTLNARTTTGRRPPGSGTSNPPSREAQPGARERLRRRARAPGRSRCRRPRRPARTRAQPLVQLEGGHRGGAVAEVDDDGGSTAARSRQPAARPASGRTRRSRFGLVVPRVTGRTPAASACHTGRCMPRSRVSGIQRTGGVDGCIRSGGSVGDASIRRGRDGHRAHLTARPAGHRRRRRHERLRARGRQRSWPTAASRSRSSPGRPRARSRRSRRARPGRRRAPRHRRARTRGCRKDGPARPAVRLRRRRDARRSRTRPRAATTSSTRTTGSPARSAGSPPTAGACRSCTRCTRWPGSRTSTSPTATARADRAARSVRRRSSRPPTGWSPTPTARPRELIDLYDADPARVAVVAAGRRPRHASRPATVSGRPARRWACRATPMRAALRRPHPAAQGPRRAAARRPPSCCAGDPELRERLVVAVLGGPSGTGLHPPERARRSSPASSASPTSCASCRRSTRADARAVVPRRRPRRSCPSLQRVVRAGRRRGAGVRHPGRRRRRRRPAHRRRRRPACSSTVTTRPTGATALEAAPAIDPGGASRLADAAVEHAAGFGWDAHRRPAARGLRRGAGRLRRARRRSTPLAAARPACPRAGDPVTARAGGATRADGRPSRPTSTTPGIEWEPGGADGRVRRDAARRAEAEDGRARCVVGDRTLSVSAFVVRNPDENHEAFYRCLLRRNLRLPGVAYAVDTVRRRLRHRAGARRRRRRGVPRPAARRGARPRPTSRSTSCSPWASSRRCARSGRGASRAASRPATSRRSATCWRTDRPPEVRPPD